MEEYLTTKEIAKLLKVHVMTVRRWITLGKLPAILLGKDYRVEKSSFENYLNQRRLKKKE